MFAAVAITTTGPLATRDRIVELAIVPVDERGAGPAYHQVFNAQMDLPYELTRLTGLHLQSTQQSPKFYQCAKQILELTEGRTLLAANARQVYSFLKKEFKDLGFNFQRKTACSVRLAQDAFPDGDNASLGHLCRLAGLEAPKEVNRAAGQAEALAMLLPYLLKMKGVAAPLLSPYLVQAAQDSSLLPPGIDKSDIRALPNAPGVYYFHNGRGDVIYVGKSISIRKRVTSHFQIDLKSPKALEFKNAIRSISYKETGSELLALLLESDEIKSINPTYNYAQKRKHFGYCLESYKDEKGYLNLKIERLATAITPHLPVSSLLAGKGVMQHLVERYQLCQKLCGLYRTKQACFDFVLKQCHGACIGKETAAEYNQRVAQALERFSYPYPAFMIVERGRSQEEVAVVLVEDNQYMGFGYIDREFADSIGDLRGCVKGKADNKDVQRIIRSYMAGAQKERVILL